MWLTAALLSAVFGAMSTLLIKQFVKRTDSTFATALRTGVVLLIAWVIAWQGGTLEKMQAISRRCILYIILSGVSTALSWLFYYRALSRGDADKIMAIEKSSILVTLSIAILAFGERSHLAVKLAGMAVIAAGLCLLVKPGRPAGENGLPAEHPAGSSAGSWIPFAFLASLFAALNTVFAKLGVSGMSSSLATALNTSVVMVVVWAVVLAELRSGRLKAAPAESGESVDTSPDSPGSGFTGLTTRREVFWIAVSGAATGACWLCYYYAVKYGPLSVVVPVNKMSVPIAVIYSHFVFGERMQPRERAGMAGIVCGMMAVAVLG